jgi:hypothetical protein
VIRSIGSLLVLALVVSGPATSCAARPTAGVPPARTAAFDAPLTLEIGASATYPDGLVVRLETIDDSRCPPDVVCIWEGELAPLLQLRGGALGTERELRLGTSRAREATLERYVVALREATTASATIVVARRA